MNVQCSLIWGFMLYKFKHSHNTAEATQTIYCMKSDGTLDDNTVTRWLKKLLIVFTWKLIHTFLSYPVNEAENMPTTSPAEGWNSLKMNMTLNCILWWSSNSRALRGVVHPFIALKTLIPVLIHLFFICFVEHFLSSRHIDLSFLSWHFDAIHSQQVCFPI